MAVDTEGRQVQSGGISTTPVGGDGRRARLKLRSLHNCRKEDGKCRDKDQAGAGFKENNFLLSGYCPAPELAYNVRTIMRFHR
ncbi:MAG: hypothetical protein ACYTBV_20935 [Planctomycetota bacterium]